MTVNAYLVQFTLLLRDETAAAMAEYALVLSLVTFGAVSLFTAAAMMIPGGFESDLYGYANVNDSYSQALP